MPDSGRMNGQGDATRYVQPQISALIPLSAGDYIELWMITSGSRDLVNSQANTYMNGFLVTES